MPNGASSAIETSTSRGDARLTRAREPWTVTSMRAATRVTLPTCALGDVVCSARRVTAPGQDYWPAEVMIDPDKASMAGLVQPTLAVSRRCHDTENVEPEHRRDFVTPSEAAWEAWVHIRDEP